MTVISIRTSQGRYWSAAGSSITLTETRDASTLFAVESLGDDAIALQTFEGGYVIADSESLSVAPSSEATRKTRLRIIDRGGERRALRAIDTDHDLGAHGETTLTFEPFELPEGPRRCCGPISIAEQQPGGLMLFWERKVHEAIVEKAVQLLGGEAVRTAPNARLFLDRFWADDQFTSQLFAGLLEADYLAPWSDPNVFSKRMFAYHFCDADSLVTMPFFSRLDSWHPYNAISEGQRYFYLGVHVARRILRLGQNAGPELFRICGHYLGLSLHFLTDLTQPMHAANFANVLGNDQNAWLDDRRHAMFEQYAEENFERFL